MRIKTWEHTGVNKDGTCVDGGSVGTQGDIRFAKQEGGCGLEHCNCSNGHWMSIVNPRSDDGVVSGVTIHFDSNQQVIHFINNFKGAMQEYIDGASDMDSIIIHDKCGLPIELCECSNTPVKNDQKTGKFNVEQKYWECRACTIGDESPCKTPYHKNGYKPDHCVYESTGTCCEWLLIPLKED